MAGRKGDASVERPHSDGTKMAHRVVGAGLVSVGVVYGLGFATNALLVPLTMTHFGTVVPGVGTLHAAGGLAATLQAFSHVVLQKKVTLEVFAAGQKKAPAELQKPP
jgi:hypothetical protein